MNELNSILRHHVSCAVERGEAVAVAGMPVVYAVKDSAGVEWSRYQYFDMAHHVANRCNKDVCLVARHPFSVSAI